MTEMDFKTWMMSVDTDDYHDIYDLYRAVENNEEYGAFSCTHKVTSVGNQYFVKCSYIDGLLMLASDDATKYFLHYLRENYMEDMDPESYYGYKGGLDRDD